ncbi:MAG: ribonuclease P protein component [Oscillospiraceae bacterium]|jgi:ribonuclease P protein component|nr:ribonuclease P protein component [Oscillospiraceae bacterium]
MKFSVSLKKNHEFRRLYNKGKSAAGGSCVIYCRKNGRGENRLGLTVSTKLGGAVRRNRIRRRLRETYRLNEDKLRRGYDVVIVARARAIDAPFDELRRDFLRLCAKLELRGDMPPKPQAAPTTAKSGEAVKSGEAARSQSTSQPKGGAK